MLRQRRSLLILVVAGAGLWASKGVNAWNEALMQRQMKERYGMVGLNRFEAWMDMLKAQAGRSQNQQLKAVNDFWNVQLHAQEDKVLWGQVDYWATPIESLGKGSGDCEDYVIGKYISLIQLGISAQKMRFIYVRARVGGMGSTASVGHMVLGFYDKPSATPLILDNLIGSIDMATERVDLTPVFSFNAEGIFVGDKKSASSDSINRWQDLLKKMRQEGSG